ncbi:hypothetical protein [Candidatus Nitrosocosmicus sp. T]
MNKINYFPKLSLAIGFGLIGVLILLIISMGVPSLNAQNSNDNLQPSVEISKTSANSYRIVNETAYIKPYFDISYIISGSSNLLNSSQNIINSTIINDFLISPTSGYIMQQNNSSNSITNATNALPALPNPFVDQETISTTIQQQLSEAISTAVDIDYFEVDIECTFGNKIQDWDCNVYSLPT